MNKLDISLYDSSNIDQYAWPDTEDGRTGRHYLLPLIKEGVQPYLENVATQMVLVACGDRFLPITINEEEYDNSYIASNYYVLKFYEENMHRKHPILLRLQKPFLYLGSRCLKAFKVNKTLFLNNWLMTNSLAPKMTSDELQAVVQLLTKKFPSHLLIFRHVDRVMKEELLNSLKRNRFELLKTRDIFIYNPKEEQDAAVRRISRRDHKLMERYGYETLRSEDLKEGDYCRIVELYSLLYVKKYTRYSPQYTEAYVKTTHQNKTVHYVAIRRKGVIEGFYSYFIYNKAMINCLFGYDTTLPHAHDIYKVLTRLVLEETERLGLMINDGSGGDSAKTKRGLKPSAEYMGLYNKHLSWPRRFLWNSIAFFYKCLTPD